jgi:hypothetical protein
MKLLNMFHFGAPRLEAQNENGFPHVHQDGDGSVVPARVRALATGAAIATSLDASPAVLVSIYDYAHNYRGKGRRSA